MLLILYYSLIKTTQSTINSALTTTFCTAQSNFETALKNELDSQVKELVSRQREYKEEIVRSFYQINESINAQVSMLKEILGKISKKLSNKNLPPFVHARNTFGVTGNQPCSGNQPTFVPMATYNVPSGCQGGGECGAQKVTPRSVQPPMSVQAKIDPTNQNTRAYGRNYGNYN
ncbi:hypothetical protein TUBRATIS_30000 [Tubulinosema ratisbonensis]|uniref:Uncharacterized protein n=1 Tax=Tubulinosema ratisbonensis TaxID=291195 RepID=A0A437AHL3_9MICR|nr:hypothetical protein TUBRATIS_30000 [Tubulinosema ratisbonensis]